MVDPPFRCNYSLNFRLSYKKLIEKRLLRHDDLQFNEKL